MITPQIDVSSTDIRERVAKSQPIDWMVPPVVKMHIDDSRLYKRTSTDAGDM
jgi:nicotinic acid mononucleotide adenylyltransferase